MRSDLRTVLADIAPGDHVCWIVEDDAAYIEAASTVLRAARALGEKPMAFGPHESPALEALSGLAAQVADPRVAFLGGGRLDPETMFTMFREQSALAREEGFRRLRLVADMDWLLPAGPTRADIVAFELLLDRHARDLGATIVCAYRKSTFGDDVLDGVMCVHGVTVGCAEPPVFQLLAGDDTRWHLSGEVDRSYVDLFQTALAAAATTGPCVLDASGLDFIDVGGLRALSDVSRESGAPIRVVGVHPLVRRCWEVAGLAERAPSVAFG